MKLAAIVAIAAIIWLFFTVLTFGLQIQTVRDRIALGEQKDAVTKSAGRVEAYRSSVDDIAERLEKRQQMLDQMVLRYFGKMNTSATAAESTEAKNQQIGSAIPEAAPLAVVEQRQLAFADSLTLVAAMRAREAEIAIRRYGIAPPKAGMGGPFIPARASDFRAQKEGRFARLATSLQKLDVLERTLLALPNSAPASPLMLSSGFGYRMDPFNGGPALHAGLDITGDIGQPIRAAAAGRVIYAGPASGYGYLLAIDHGHGIETRYGHLSGFVARLGDAVARGQQVALMGNTGRSTGTHLHFEVRINGRAINPRPFLEANSDVLKVQDNVKRRFDRLRVNG